MDGGDSGFRIWGDRAVLRLLRRGIVNGTCRAAPELQSENALSPKYEHRNKETRNKESGIENPELNIEPMKDDVLNDIIEFQSSPEIRKLIYDLSYIKVFNEGEIILRENAYVKGIPIVSRGALKVLRTDEDGREILLYYIRAGESCIMSLLGGIAQDTSKVKAIAQEETEILFLPVDKLNELIRTYPEWLSYIFRLYHQRFEELLEVVNAVAFKKTDERLLNLLQTKRTLSRSKILSVTHEQLANELGTVRVVISRLLKQLEDDGKVQLGRNKITMID